jgi:transmembrane sensor
MDPLSKQDFPWELITDSFLGSLSPEGELEFHHWLSSDPANKDEYSRLQELWIEGMEDYKFYLVADEKKSWNKLQTKLNLNDEKKVIKVQFNNKSKPIRNIISIAAVLIIVIGFGYLFNALRNSSVVYDTALNEQRKINLSDGSVIELKSQTKIEVSKAYNKKNRSIIMDYGEASFEVLHVADKPFVVELGNTKVEDIGTVFIVQKGKENIKVSVSDGKVAFTNIETKESRELIAGMSLNYNIAKKSFDKIEQQNTPLDINKISLDFENTSLYDVIKSVQKVYGVKIQTSDTIVGQKKLTAHFYEMPVNSVMEVICKSLELEYSVKNSVYLLKQKSDK